MPSYAPPSNSSDLRVKGKVFPCPRDVTGATLVSSPTALLAHSSHSSLTLFLQHLGRAPTYSLCSTQVSHPHPTVLPFSLHPLLTLWPTQIRRLSTPPRTPHLSPCFIFSISMYGFMCCAECITIYTSQLLSLSPTSELLKGRDSS